LVVVLGVFLTVGYAMSTGRITMYWYQVIQIAAITAISALGLNLIYGFNGQFSLGHVGFYAIGAYGSALISKDFMSRWSGAQFGALSWMMAGQIGLIAAMLGARALRPGDLRKRLRAYLSQYIKGHESSLLSGLAALVGVILVVLVGAAAAWLMQKLVLVALNATLGNLARPVAEQVVFILALVNGGTMAALVAYLVGLALLRLGSDYFGIATLGFAIMVYTSLQNSDVVIETMKGARGMVAIPRWTTWGWAFGVLVLLAVVMRNLIHSSHGRSIMSIREDEIASQTMGIDVTQLKAVAFAFGAFFAGVAGGLYAHLFGFLHPSTFNMIRGFDPLIIIVWGGLGSMTGTIVASGMFALVTEGLRVVLPQGFEDWRFVLYPILLLIIMLLRPQGLLGTSEWGWLRAPLPPSRDIPVPDRSLRGEVAVQEGKDA
jgi:branched-chain amino acid transport system permease protein